MANGNLNELEAVVVRMETAGREWVKAKLLADQLDDDTKSYLASIMNELDDGKTSEAKLDRLARGSKEFREFVRSAAIARADMLKKKVRYDGEQSLFEAKRSEYAMERSKIEKGIFHTGGK